MSTVAALRITVNGEEMALEAPVTLEQLIARMSLTGKRIALERNGEIVPRSRYGQQTLAEGDRLEIVVAVGGG